MEKQDSLKAALGFRKNETIVVVGSGGKTTFCLELCEELKNENKVFFTTNTKILEPKMREKYKIYISKNILEEKFLEKGAYILGQEINKEKKILPFDLDIIDKLREKCDYLIIEGDGSKMKPLKAWNENEPVFVKSTNKTVGIIPIKAVGLTLNEENVHRIDKFLKMTHGSIGENINIGHLYEIITEDKGLFKDSMGEKILFINQVENDQDFENSMKLVNLLKEKSKKLDKIIISSLKDKKYYLV